MLIISGHHNHLVDSQALKSSDNILCLCSKRIRNQDGCRKLSVYRKIQRRVFLRNGIEFFFFSLWNLAMLIFKNKVIATDKHSFSFVNTGDAVRYYILHLGVALRMVQITKFRLRNHCIRHRVGIMFFQAGCHTEHLIFILSHKGNNLLYLRLSVGQRSRLIEYYGICLGNGFHKFTALDGNMIFSRFSHCGKNRNRHRKFQCAGEIHHQEGQCLCYIPGQQVGQYRPAQAVRNKLIRKVRCSVFRRTL